MAATLPGYPDPGSAPPGTGAIGLPYPSGGRGTRMEKKRLRDLGMRGADLSSGMDDFRTKRRTAMDQWLGTQVSPEMSPYIRNPRRFARNVLSGKGPALARLMYLKQAGHMLGYDQSQQAIQEETLGQLQAGAPVDSKFDERPTYDAFGGYLRGRLTPEGDVKGLSDTEANAIRGRERGAVEASSRDASRQEGNRLTAAGIDPRSGLANQRALQLSRGRQAGLTDVERDVTLQDLARKSQIEGLLSGESSREEGGRQYDVGAQLSRLAQVEGGARSLSGLSEGQREFDTTYTESQRQAKMARDAARKAGKAMEPSSLEKWAGGAAGLFKGLGV